MWKVITFTFVVVTNTFNIVPNIYNVSLGYNDAPSNTIKVHDQYFLQCYDKTKDYETFMNDDEYQILIVGMRHATFDVSNHSTTSTSKANYAILWAHHRSSTKGCCNKKTINNMLAYWISLARQVRATTT